MSRARSTALYLLVLAIAAGAQIPRLAGARWSLFDTRIYRDATRLALHGGDLYGAVFEGGWPYTYPPFSVLLFSPLTAVGEAFGTGVLTLLSVAALGRIAWLVAEALVDRLARRGAVPDALRGAALPLAATGVLLLHLWSDPVQGTFGFGQVNLLLAWLVTEDYLGHGAGRRWGGAGTALAAGVKVTPALSALPRMILSPRRTIPVVLGTGALEWARRRFARNWSAVNAEIEGVLKRQQEGEA